MRDIKTDIYFFNQILHCMCYFLKNLFEMMQNKWIYHLWVYYSCFEPCLLLNCYVECQHPWHENQLINICQANSCSSVIAKFFIKILWHGRHLTDADAAYFLSWMTLVSLKSYINIMGKRKIIIFSDFCWCLFNDSHWWQQ